MATYAELLFGETYTFTLIAVSHGVQSDPATYKYTIPGKHVINMYISNSDLQ